MQELEKAARQALTVLEEATSYTSSPSWSPSMTDECKWAAAALRAALEPVAPAMPDGWKLVPVEPTHDMLGKGQREWLDSDGADPSYDIYQAMLAAAPRIHGIKGE